MARRIGWIFMALLVLAFAVGNIRFFVDPDFSTALGPQVFIDNAMLVRIHILAVTFSILTGPFQFWAGFRNRHRNWHRLMGRIYLGAAVVGVASALYIAWISFGGFPAHIGFFVLALGWGGTTAMAYRRIRAGNWKSHREWMIRSYSLVLGIIGIRFWLGIFRVMGVENEPAFGAAAWIGWVNTLLVAELYIGWYRNRQASAVAAE